MDVIVVVDGFVLLREFCCCCFNAVVKPWATSPKGNLDHLGRATQRGNRSHPRLSTGPRAGSSSPPVLNCPQHSQSQAHSTNTSYSTNSSRSNCTVQRDHRSNDCCRHQRTTIAVSRGSQRWTVPRCWKWGRHLQSGRRRRSSYWTSGCQSHGPRRQRVLVWRQDREHEQMQIVSKVLSSPSTLSLSFMN